MVDKYYSLVWSTQRSSLFKSLLLETNTTLFFFFFFMYNCSALESEKFAVYKNTAAE